MFLRVFHPESLLQLFCSCHDILDSNAVHGEESLVRSRLSELILVMSVEPGFGGQKYIPESTERIRRLREEAKRVNPGLHIEVDGGVKLDNVKMIVDAGASMIVAGSAVLGGDDVEEKARAFMEILEP